MSDKPKNRNTSNFNPTHRYINPVKRETLLVELVRDCGYTVVVAGEDGNPFACPAYFIHELRRAA